MYSEDDLIPISALQHILFCPRQYALIHLEQLWEENRFTMEGNVLHERVDSEHHESRRTYRQEFGMALRSLEYGLVGKGDLVELFSSSNGKTEQVIPVEFKRGTDKENDCDRVQLCAQALCLEEMFQVPVESGQFYYLKDHRRTKVSIDSTIRATTLDALQQIREILGAKLTPPAIYEKRKCNACSLMDICMPQTAGSGKKNVGSYLEEQLTALRDEYPL